MNIEVTTFQQNTHELTASIRVIRDANGDPWFIAKDVCETLGLGNPTKALLALDDDEKKTEKLSGFRGSSVNLISESGMYALIVRSNKAEAKRFRKWVTSDVLPSIRKHGAYVKGAEQLSPEAQTEFYRIVQNQLTHALQRHDRLTQHDHWRTPVQQQARSKIAAAKVAEQLGLPLHLVETCADSGVANTLQALAAK
ncbi:BRO-N domain-containing protein [Paludibacterium denitrificans]|uniref:Bro-N domain-containing protein n=1 Tax=Paludibacterium denitrificans TaxID=2675226 RepID=A0A844GAG1_9NEIS|nr:Bro-N domain-containing protein [Paludibacterium denitrificans]MTD33436.1 hypothetical protein [Paludibacterium denitrificans]